MIVATLIAIWMTHLCINSLILTQTLLLQRKTKTITETKNHQHKGVTKIYKDRQTDARKDSQYHKLYETPTKILLMWRRKSFKEECFFFFLFWKRCNLHLTNVCWYMTKIVDKNTQIIINSKKTLKVLVSERKYKGKREKKLNLISVISFWE